MAVAQAGGAAHARGGAPVTGDRGGRGRGEEEEQKGIRREETGSTGYVGEGVLAREARA